MNWDRIEGGWKQRRGKAVQYWGKMMNDELAAIAGKYEELVGRLQEKYGIASENSIRQIEDLKQLVSQLKKSNAKLMTLQARLNSIKSGSRKATTAATSRKRRSEKKHSTTR